MSEISEQTALADVKRRLIQEFPEFPEATPAGVDAAVSAAHVRFDRRPIRDFVPLFVKKHARRRIAQRHMATSAG